MDLESKTLQNSPSPAPPGLNLVRTQKRLMLKRVFEIIKAGKDIKLEKLVAKMYIEEGFSKKTAKEYIEMLYNADYISIEGEHSKVKIKKELE